MSGEVGPRVEGASGVLPVDLHARPPAPRDTSAGPRDSVELAGVLRAARSRLEPPDAARFEAARHRLHSGWYHSAAGIEGLAARLEAGLGG